MQKKPHAKAAKAAKGKPEGGILSTETPFTEPIRKFVCGSEEREKKAHEQDEDGKDGTRSF
jgi:hypothetical protein